VNTPSPTRFARLRSRELLAPLRELAGLRYLEHGPGRLDEAMDVPPWLRDADGGVSAAALLILADSTLAAAAGTSIGPDRVPVTRRFHFELLARPPVHAGCVVASARVVQADDAQATTRGDLRADGGLVAIASMRTAIVADTGRRPAPPAELVPEGSAGRDDGPSTGDAWPLAPVAAHGDGRDGRDGRDAETVVRTPARARHANSIGTLHGGVVAAIGERAVQAALAPTLGPATRAVLGDLVVDYLRPVPADDQAVEVRVEVRHRTERFAVAHATITRADGATAALVRATADLLGA